MEIFGGIFGVLSCVGVVLLFIVMGLSRTALQVIKQYERGVVFNFGKYSGIREPGLTFIIPIFQTMTRVDMRLQTSDIPRQEVMTKDNIPMLVNAVVYFRVLNPETVIIEIADYSFAIRQYTQAALRDVIGNSEMDNVLTERESIAEAIQKIVDSETDAWGVDVESIKIQEVELPAEMKRAMAKQAEAERERRAMIINADGELSASVKLNEAAEILGKNPGAMHLRTLQTLRDIAQDPSEKIVMLIPSSLGEAVSSLVSKKG